MMSLLKSWLAPMALPYDFQEWKKLPFSERAKKICGAWALQGFGAPFTITLFYLLKILFYILIWFYFCSFSSNLGGWETVGEWWFELEALGKAIAWTTLLEVIGFGGASGPLTGRYVPPLGGITYFLRPRTIKVPLFPKAPFIGGDQRTFVEVILYLGLLGTLLHICLASEITPSVVLPAIVLLPVLGILDRTVYLAARADIYFPMLVCFLFPMEMGAALKLIWFGIWFWAAFSKLTPNFTSVICVMICNSPVLSARFFDGFKKRLFRRFPDDLRPSTMAKYLAHFGTLIEFSMPFILVFGGNYPTVIFGALATITAFHLFIFLNCPMGVPMEWNVIMVFGAWLLFGAYPDLLVWQLTSSILIGFLFLVLVVFPIIGNLFPKYVSFLLSMRYYAGTWAYSVWLFKGRAKDRLDENLVKTSKDVVKQLLFFYDRPTADAIASRVLAFRMMHLPGRLLQDLLPLAVEQVDDYEWVDGEFIAGEVVGWNFGDGHLHHEPILAAIQKRCNYSSGELRVIMVESPQFHTQNLAWRIYDAQDGLLAKGQGNTRVLQERLPWAEE